MRHLYKYIMVAIFALVADIVVAQEVVSDELIRDRVTSYISTSSNDMNNLTTVNYIGHKAEESVRWTNDIRIGYGAPGVLSLLLLDESFIFDYEAVHIPETLPGRVDRLHTNRGPMRRFMTLSANYHRQIKPWFALGCKSSFAGIWQSTFDSISGEKRYSDNVYNIAALVDARFSWLRRDMVEMYSSVGLGLMAHIERMNGALWPMFDIAAIGISVGRSFYGFLEIGAGCTGSARIGFGFRFNDKK